MEQKKLAEADARANTLKNAAKGVEANNEMVRVMKIESQKSSITAKNGAL
jgi:hypothetical protein